LLALRITNNKEGAASVGKGRRKEGRGAGERGTKKKRGRGNKKEEGKGGVHTEAPRRAPREGFRRIASGAARQWPHIPYVTH
jgi:hypothetical protein